MLGASIWNLVYLSGGKRGREGYIYLDFEYLLLLCYRTRKNLEAKGVGIYWEMMTW